MKRRFWLYRAVSGKYGLLTVALLLLLATASLITLGRAWSVGYGLIGSCVLVSCIYASCPRRSWLMLGVGLAVFEFGLGQAAARTIGTACWWCKRP